MLCMLFWVQRVMEGDPPLRLLERTREEEDSCPSLSYPNHVSRGRAMYTSPENINPCGHQCGSTNLQTHSASGDSGVEDAEEERTHPPPKKKPKRTDPKSPAETRRKNAVADTVSETGKQPPPAPPWVADPDPRLTENPLPMRLV